MLHYNCQTTIEKPHSTFDTSLAYSHISEYPFLYPIQCHTLTSDTGIFRMATIVNANSTVRAVPKPGLSAIAGHIIQQDGSSSLAKCSRGEGCCTCQSVVYTHSTVSNSNTFNEEQSKISEKTVMFKLHVLCTVYIVTCRRESKLLTGHISISSSP